MKKIAHTFGEARERLKNEPDIGNQTYREIVNLCCEAGKLVHTMIEKGELDEYNALAEYEIPEELRETPTTIVTYQINAMMTPGWSGPFVKECYHLYWLQFMVSLIQQKVKNIGQIESEKLNGLDLKQLTEEMIKSRYLAKHGEPDPNTQEPAPWEWGTIDWEIVSELLVQKGAEHFFPKDRVFLEDVCRLSRGFFLLVAPDQKKKGKDKAKEAARKYLCKYPNLTAPDLAKLIPTARQHAYTLLKEIEDERKEEKRSEDSQ